MSDINSGLLKLHCVCESPGNLVKTQTLIQKVWGGASELAFLTSF